MLQPGPCPCPSRQGRLLFVLFFSLAGAAGLFFGLPNALLHLPPLALVYPFCLYILSGQAQTGKQALLWGWFAALAANAACLYWLVYPMHDVAGIPFALALPTALLLHAYLACYAALGVYGLWGLRRLLAPCAAKACARKKGRALAAALAPPLVGALAFGGLEAACGFLFSGFPWLALSTALAFDPLWIQTASVWGAYTLGALLTATAFFAANALQASQKIIRTASLCAAFGLPVCLAAIGFTQMQKSPPYETPLSFIMVQGNIDQNQKWLPQFQKSTLDHYLILSRKALLSARATGATPLPSLVIWPETAMPFYYPLHWEFAEEIRAFAQEQGVSLAFGALGVDTSGAANQLRNRFFLLPPNKDMAGWYDKRHLVPFGEYLPFGSFLPYLQELLQGMDFVPGRSAGILSLPYQSASGLKKGDSLSLGVLICYEAIFPELAAQTVDAGAQVLLNVSNDGWFRQSSAPYQHLAHAVLRAVEQRRPLVRVTNTGISVVVDAKGRITHNIEGMFVSGVLQAQVTPGRGATLYNRLYPLPELALGIIALALVGAGCVASRHNARNGRR